ncbi:hypothetical protein KC362_g13 [Hortaea werneckii]|nr:hypothetical protein KC362_g13 [Hortaea werneckii]
MHSVLLNSLLFGLAVAAPNPLPQGIDFGAVDAAPMPTALGPQPEKTVDVVSYDSTSAAAAASSQVLATASASANVKRTDDDSDGDDAACDTEKLEVGKGELTRNPDTAAAFHDNDHYAQAAKAAKAPAGYKEAFNNLQSSVEMIGYHGLRTIGEYDPELCAELCKKDEGCVAFNMYFERSPSYATSDTCRDPPSTTYIKCTFYGFPISAEASTNKQQHRHDFDVVRAGSNAYNREDIPAPKVDDFDAPTELDCAINAPLDPKTGKDTYVGMSAFKTSYDPGHTLTMRATTISATSSTRTSSTRTTFLRAWSAACTLASGTLATLSTVVLGRELNSMHPSSFIVRSRISAIGMPSKTPNSTVTWPNVRRNKHFSLSNHSLPRAPKQ